jgi:hypothetical protein
MLLLMLGMMAASLLGGCTQMTRHSNMMIFGTNTVVGLRAGTTSTSVPEVALGYARQEAVVLPLVANVVTDRNSPVAKRDHLEPCNLTAKLEPDPALLNDGRGYRIHPCSLVAWKDGAQDSYSVLASFGGTFRGSGESGSREAEGGVAQYFSTGMAAQILALNAGAAAVASGIAARSAADKPSMTLTGIISYKSDPAKEKLEAYLDPPVSAQRQSRFLQLSQVAAALKFPSQGMELVAFVESGSEADHEKLLNALRLVETDPAALAALQ